MHKCKMLQVPATRSAWAAYLQQHWWLMHCWL